MLSIIVKTHRFKIMICFLKIVIDNIVKKECPQTALCGKPGELEHFWPYPS